MSKKIKKSITISIIIILIIVAVISTFFIIKYFIEKNRIDNVYETYSNENVQDRINTKDNTINDDLMLQIDGERVLGVIKIDKIDYEGLIYEGTSLNTLDKGIGHFENSPYLEGNVCLAGHNYIGVWKNLHTLENGDTITYTSFLGTKEYEVNNVTQISETDWTLLENTAENYLTLITCVKKNPTQRLAVQAIERK